MFYTLRDGPWNSGFQTVVLAKINRYFCASFNCAGKLGLGNGFLESENNIRENHAFGEKINTLFRILTHFRVIIA